MDKYSVVYLLTGAACMLVICLAAFLLFGIIIEVGGICE